ncbi:RNA-binding domain-containing protein [Mycoplasma procyoni]|uniref:RNA-binding domain-containing protein n=1 Tax=Mycoplasma procyoni TaxID=568784 RepID=UPI00197C76F9|nr:RNA-binding domain-containing protein [Mycoplasma procyoni]MBN3534492.1 putative DNA binding domain-containing protein [Mycoplasma procyoni]
MSIIDKKFLEILVKELRLLTKENEWVEFKVNNVEPFLIGEYISALSNSVALLKRNKGYLIWGINDITHEIVGTSFDYRNAKKGSENLELWLTRMLTPKINFEFHDIFIEDKKVVILIIDPASGQPTQFEGKEFIRIGSSKKPLKDFPEKEKKLWKVFDNEVEELKIAKHNNNFEDLKFFLDIENYYKKINHPLPENKDKIIDDLINEKFIKKSDANLYDITNMGALLIAKNIKDFEYLNHKDVRVIWYKGNNKLETIRERNFTQGYALSYEEIIEYIMTIIPQQEVIENGIRISTTSYPRIAIREIVSNLLIHQSIEQKGTNPMIEVFENRIEFSNAGSLLISVDRIIDSVPVSRNENIAGFMHKCGICEERGSGYDKILFETIKERMMAPKIENQDDKFTKVTLFSKIPFDLMSKEDKIRTCYMFVCLSYIMENKAITNNSVRETFGLDEKDKYKISRILKDLVDLQLIKIIDNNAPKHTKYIPFWA